MPLPPLVADLVDEATGRRVRGDAVRPLSGGPAGNAQLTAWTGALLLTLVLAELVTLLDVSGFIGWHVALGALLVPLALLKTASTGWRFLRYHRGDPDHRAAGPPPTLLRVLGPLVVSATLGVLTSGILLIALGDERGRRTLFSALGRRIDLVTVHQALFIAFAVTAGLHLLARLARLVELLSGRAHRAPGGQAAVPGRAGRAAALAVTLATAGLSLALLLPLAGNWHDDRGDPGRPPPRSSPG